MCVYVQVTLIAVVSSLYGTCACHVMTGIELGDWLVWFVVDEYDYSETTTTQACLLYA